MQITHKTVINIRHDIFIFNDKETKRMKPLIVVVGATGKQGGSVINALIQSGKWRIRGLSRQISSNDSQVELIENTIELFDSI